MSKNLSQIVADLFSNPTEGKDLSSQIKRLGDELRNVLHGEDTTFGKFRGLLESFRDVIPDEQQRYLAAIKALSTTAKMNRQEIIKSISGQLEELKIVEKGIVPSLSGWSDGLKTMEARLQQLKGELAQLRERVAQLESEEKTLQTGMAAREKDLKNAEKMVKDIFADISAEISALNKKVEELSAEGAAGQPGPPSAQPSPTKEPVKSAAPVKKKGGEEKVEIKLEPVPEDTKFQRKCPQCGGRFNLHELESLWQCYTCGYEEPATGPAPAPREEKSEPAPAPNPEPAPSFVEPLASMVNDEGGSKQGKSLSNTVPAAKKKTCPGCRKTMFWYPNEKAWRCPSCGYERRVLRGAEE